METLWALVANSSSAKIFEITGHGKHITKLHHLDHPSGRKKGSDINTDKAGSAVGTGGTRRHGLSTEVDPHDHDQQQFAHEICTFLTKSRDSFSQLALIAPPQFLGKLKQELSDPLKKCVAHEIQKDLPESVAEQEVIDHLCKYLDLWNR